MGVTATATAAETYSAAVASLPHDIGVLGRYVLLETVGHGGMGVVWKAYDPVLDRNIALKLLVPSSAARGTVVAEAQAMARVQHPNVVTVYDAGVHDAGPHQLAYIAMELVASRTLKDWLEVPGRSIEDQLDTFLLAGRGLEAAHEAELVHRDFKPSNVLIDDDGRVRVSDFGLSVLGSGDQAGTSSPFAGTPHYMSPEQLHGLPATAGSDQFAFCVALYEALFGDKPFAARNNASVAELRASILTTPKPRVRTRLQSRLAPIVLRGLSSEPSQRWTSMSELLTALGAARGSRRKRVVAAGAIAAILVASAVFGWREMHSTARVCRHAADPLTALLRPERRQALAAAFGQLTGGADAFKRAEAAIDEWAGRWSTLRVEQCEADRNGERPSPSLAARRACLDRRLGELDALLRVLDKPDATIVTYVSGAARSLTAPESCMTIVPSLDAPPPPPLGQGVGEVHAQIDRAKSLFRLGKEQPALAEAKTSVAAAVKVDWAPLTAEAQLILARILLRANSTEPAMETFYKAWWTAEKARDDDLRVEAARGLQSTCLQASDYPQAARWLETAKAITQHLPPDNLRAASLAFDGLNLLLYQGQYNDCLRDGTEALRLAEAVGQDSSVLVNVLDLVGECERSLDHREEAATAHFKRALAISEKIYGHDHQETSSILTNLGIMARKARDYDAALAYYRDALGVRAHLVGPDNPDCAILHNNISNIYRDQKRYDEAKVELDRAVEIWTKTFGPDSPAVSLGLKNLARLAMEQHHPEQAEPMYRRALEIRRKKRPAGHPEIAQVAQALGICLLAQHKPDALPLLEEALSSFEKDNNVGAEEKAEGRFWVGRARIELGIRTEGALALATSSCKELVDPSMKDEAAECHAWLEKHPR